MHGEISNLSTLTFIYVWRQFTAKKWSFPLKISSVNVTNMFYIFIYISLYVYIFIYIYIYIFIYIYIYVYICIYTEYTTLKKPSSGETRQNTSVVQSFLLTNFPSPSFTYIYISERYVYISGLPTLMWLSTLIWLHPWIRYTHVITYSKFLLK